jgi:hypothetical protein
VVGRLDRHPLPALLAPRLFVDLYPELLPGIGDLVRLWQEDYRVEEQIGKPVVSNALLSDGENGVSLYVTSDLFGVTVPVKIDLSVPAGVVTLGILERLSLPNSLDHRGQIGVRFEYRLILDQLPLNPSAPLANQGVKGGSVLWLECTMRPFAAKAPQSGTLEAVAFRGQDVELLAWRAARKRLSAAVQATKLSVDFS